MALIEKIFNPLSSFHHKRISRYLNKLDIEKIIDIGCGQGGTLSYYCRKYNKLKFIGLDYRNYNVKISRYLSKKYKIKKEIKMDAIFIVLVLLVIANS